MKDIPSRLEVNPAGGGKRDASSPLELFVGLNYEQAVELFRKDSLAAIEHMKSMGINAFLYYLKSLNLYLKEADLSDSPLLLVITAHYVRMTFHAMFENGHKQAIVADEAANSIRLHLLSKLEEITAEHERIAANEPPDPDIDMDEARKKCRLFFEW